jgi:uncharacterized protein
MGRAKTHSAIIGCHSGTPTPHPRRSRLLRRYFAFLLRHRLATLAVCAVLTAVALAAASRGVIASSIGKLFLDDMPDYALYKERMVEFGSDEFFVVACEDPAPLSPASLERVARVVDRIGAEPEVAKVTSLADAVRLEDQGGMLTVSTYGDLARDGDAGAVGQLLLDDPVYQGALLAKDGKSAAIVVELAHDPYRAVERGPLLVGHAMEEFQSEGWAPDQVHRAGLPALIAEVMDQTYINMSRIFPVSGVALLLVVWALFRKLSPAVVTLGIGLVSVAWTLGFSTLLAREFSVFTGVVPAVVLTVAFSDVVHLWSAYHLELRRGLSKTEAILESATDVGTACLLTSATTFTGFISLAAVPTPMARQLGIVLGFGVGAALLLAMTLVPVALSLLPEPELREGDATGRFLDPVVSWCARVSTRHAKVVLVLFALAMVPVGYGISTFTIGTDFSERLGEGNDYRADLRFFEEHFAGTNTVSIFVETDAPGGLTDTAVMARVGALQTAIEALPEVDQVLSPVNVFRALHRSLAHEEGLPDQPGAIGQYLLLLEMSDTGGHATSALAGQLNFERTLMRMDVRTKLGGFRQLGRLGNQVKALGEPILGDAAAMEVTGVAYLLGSYFDEILAGQRNGLLFSLGVIGVMMGLGLRSVRAGVLSMIPNLMPLAAVLAWASFRYEAVDSDLLIVAVMALGIGVDDTIHFLVRHRVESLREGATVAADGSPDPDAPLRRTFAYAGRAILMTTVILCAGFLPFAFSDYFSVDMLGTFLPGALVVAVLADLLLVPAMVKVGWFRYR